MFIIHSNNKQLAKKINQQITGNLIDKRTHFLIENNVRIDLSSIRDKFLVDINYLANNLNLQNIKVFVSDMDSTLINIECIDEIADFANIRPQVAKITKSAMNNDIDFNTALKSRVALLKNLNKNILDKVYQEKLKINQGGENLINFLKSRHIKIAVVSGGFDFFTKKLKHRLSLDYELSNKLEIIDNKLTGIVNGTIINAKLKANFIRELPFDNKQIITCGDGANDLEMMKVSGLSIAYHAKEVVNKQADIIIKYGSLDKIIDLFNNY